MNKILLFGGGLQSLSIARGLKNKGYEVFNKADNHAVGKFSKFIDHFEIIDLETFDISMFLKALKRDNIDVIIPMEDEYAEWLSINKNIIETQAKCKVAITDYELFNKVIDKHKLLSFCRDNNIPHPITVSINQENSSNLKHFQFPALIKPNIANGSRGITLVRNYEEFKLKISKITSDFGTCSLQEYIKNNHYYNVMLYRYNDGSFGPTVATKITRYYPIKGGSSSLCTSIYDEELFNICKILLTDLNWQGFADFDVLENAKGEYKIIELNPRVPASVHAAYISGINYGEIIVNDMLNDKTVKMTYSPGKQLRCLGLDIAWFIASPDRFKSQPSWFKFFNKDLHYQEGGLKDWRAMAYSIWRGFQKQLSPSFRKAKSGMN